jgi:hypothetical protein
LKGTSATSKPASTAAGFAALALSCGRVLLLRSGTAVSSGLVFDAQPAIRPTTTSE